MKSKLFIITELLDGDISPSKPVVWQHALTHDNRKITFWGKINPLSMRNIKAIENQELPFIAEIIGSEESFEDKRRYGTDIKVNEGSCVIVNSMPAYEVQWLITPENIKNVEHILSKISIIQNDYSEKDGITNEPNFLS